MLDVDVDYNTTKTKGSIHLFRQEVLNKVKNYRANKIKLRDFFGAGQIPLYHRELSTFDE